MADPVSNIKHGEYLLELVQERKSLYEQVEYPLWGVMGELDLNGANFSMGQVLITKPLKMGGETHSHDFDQVLMFLGEDPRNIRDFDAEVEMFLGDRYIPFNFAACIHVPAGTWHAPLIVKRVTRPLVYIDITLAPKESDQSTRKMARQ